MAYMTRFVLKARKRQRHTQATEQGLEGVRHSEENAAAVPGKWDV